jgi:hypothetical protein
MIMRSMDENITAWIMRSIISNMDKNIRIG